MAFPGNTEDYRELYQECQHLNGDPRRLYVSKVTMRPLDGLYYFVRGIFIVNNRMLFSSSVVSARIIFMTIFTPKLATLLRRTELS